MINAVLSQEQAFGQRTNTADLYGAVHFTRYQLYGGGDDPPRFWVTGDRQGLLSLTGGELTVSGHFEDLEELASFCAISGAKRVRGPGEILAPLARELGWAAQKRQILYALQECRTEIVEGIEEASLREVYPILQQVFSLQEADFPGWYWEVSYKIRHGLGRVLGVRREEKLACTAGIYHQNHKAALLGSVATLPEYRGNHFAGALVAQLANRARTENRIPFVVCQNPVALGVYKDIGFAPYGEEWILSRGKKPMEMEEKRNQ